MTENVEMALARLEKAMGIEQEGSQFHFQATQTMQDQKGQAMFGILAKDEQTHGSGRYHGSIMLK